MIKGVSLSGAEDVADRHGGDPEFSASDCPVRLPALRADVGNPLVAQHVAARPESGLAVLALHGFDTGRSLDVS